MNAIQTLTKDQLDALLREGEFLESVRLAAPKVIEKGLSDSPGPIQDSPCAFARWASPCS